MSLRSTKFAISAVLIVAVAAAGSPHASAQATWPGADTYVNADKDAASWVLPARNYSGNR